MNFDADFSDFSKPVVQRTTFIFKFEVPCGTPRTTGGGDTDDAARGGIGFGGLAGSEEIVSALRRVVVKYAAKAAVKTIATGQRHHLLSNKIVGALERHPNLKGAFSREDPQFIYNALDDAAHKGYQTWHR